MLSTSFKSVEYDFRFRSPFGALCMRPTGSGKTQYVLKMLQNKNQVFDRPPTRIVFAYAEWQKAYDEMLAVEPKIEFVKNLSDILENDNFFSKAENNLLILDDLASAVAESRKASDLFTRGIHHRNVDCLHICQNIFQQGKSMRNLHLNSSYMILFKNVRDVAQMKLLAKQTGQAYSSAAYEKVTASPYEPVIIDLKPNCPEELRVRNHILPGQKVRVYTSSGQDVGEN